MKKYKAYRVCVVCNNLFNLRSGRQKRCIRCINTQPKRKYWVIHLKTKYKIIKSGMGQFKMSKTKWLKKLHQKLNINSTGRS